jgi:hypothetical protein
MNTTNYMHNKLSEIFGTDNYADVMNTPQKINQVLKISTYRNKNPLLKVGFYYLKFKTIY